VPELEGITPGRNGCVLPWSASLSGTIPAAILPVCDVLREFPADIIVGDDMMFGVVPMLLGPRSERPPIVLCGHLDRVHWRRDDGAPLFLACRPRDSEAQRRRNMQLIAR